MNLTPAQLRKFFSAVKSAAENVGESPEIYRHKVIRQELGLSSLKDVSRTTGYDKLMQRVLADAGEFEAALEFVGGDVKRFRFLSLRAATRILINQGDPDPNETGVYKYVASVIFQMKFSKLDRDSLAFKLRRVDGWDDFTPMQLKKVVAALQKHVRRSAK